MISTATVSDISASRHICVTGYCRDHHKIAISHFCRGSFDLEKKLDVLIDLVVLQVVQYQQTPSEPAWLLFLSLIGTWHLIYSIRCMYIMIYYSMFCCCMKCYSPYTIIRGWQQPPCSEKCNDTIGPQKITEPSPNKLVFTRVDAKNCHMTSYSIITHYFIFYHNY